MTIRDHDNGAKKLMRNLKKEITIMVGVQGTEASQAHAGGEDTVADIASKHEFGIDVPQRSFIRDWFDQNIHENKKLLDIIPRLIAKGFSIQQSSDQIGLKMVGSIQERISSGIPPELSQITIDLKGSSTPLINTGQLRSSITYIAKVRK